MDIEPENTLVSEPAAPPPTIEQESTLENSNLTDITKDTPLPAADPAPLPPPGSTAPIPPPGSTAPLPSPGATAPAPVPAPVPVPPAPRQAVSTVLPPIPHPHSFHGPSSRGKPNGAHPPLTLNQLAIVAASQNKLPTSRVKGIVMRMGRHTQSSAKKLGRWYKSDNYVDNANYSWRNMELFIDYQKQMYTPCGTIKASCKK